MSQGRASENSQINVPMGALVVLIGAAASGKSTFATAQFVADTSCRRIGYARR